MRNYYDSLSALGAAQLQTPIQTYNESKRWTVYFRSADGLTKKETLIFATPPTIYRRPLPDTIKIRFEYTTLFGKKQNVTTELKDRTRDYRLERKAVSPDGEIRWAEYREILPE